MNITVFGENIVGLTLASCFSEMGNTVYFINFNSNCDCLSDEPYLLPLIKKNKDTNLIFTKDVCEALDNTNIIFITSKNNLNDLLKVIGDNLTQNSIIILKEIVPLGTTLNVKHNIQDILDNRGANVQISVAFNPEFLKQGYAVHDFMRPQRIVIGAEDNNSFQILKELYSPFVQNHPRFALMPIIDAEMVAQAYNAMVSFENSLMNEITCICELNDVNIENVRKGVGLDSKLNHNFMSEGRGYKEQSYPGDLSFFIEDTSKRGYDSLILSNSLSFSQIQKDILINKIISKFGEDLSEYMFCIWGLVSKKSDKSEDNIEESFVSNILDKGGKINVCGQSSNFLESVCCLENKYDALKDCDALIVLNDFDEFKNPDFKLISQNLKQNVIFDGINLYNKKIEKQGFELFQIGC